MMNNWPFKVCRHFKHGTLYVFYEKNQKYTHSETGEFHSSYRNIITQEPYIRPEYMIDEEVEPGVKRFEFLEDFSYGQFLEDTLVSMHLAYLFSSNTTRHQLEEFISCTLSGIGWRPYGDAPIQELEDEYIHLTDVITDEWECSVYDLFFMSDVKERLQRHMEPTMLQTLYNSLTN